jgi:hypothetical protein
VDGKACRITPYFDQIDSQVGRSASARTTSPQTMEAAQASVVLGQ